MKTNNIIYKGSEYTAQDITLMREWIADCQWNDLDEDCITELTDTEVLRGVNSHYGGGLSQFIKDNY